MTRYFRPFLYTQLLFLALFALAACKTGAASVEGVSTDIEVTYRREGGFAGIAQEWVLFPDGRIEGSDGQEMQAPAEEAIALLAELKALESLRLPETYIGEETCCDQYIYTITLRVGDQTTVIQTSDGADHPEEVSTLLADIEKLIANGKPVK